jgi:hypothetical protein
MLTGTPVPDAVFLTPNEYQTISRIGRTKKNTYHRIEGTASANEGPRHLRRRGGVGGSVNIPNATGGRGLAAIDTPTLPSFVFCDQHQEPAAALTLLRMSTKRSSPELITWVRIVSTCVSAKKIMSPYLRSGLSSVNNWSMPFMPEL